jgi:hypothetical protein
MAASGRSETHALPNSGQSRVAATRRRNFHQQGVNDPLAQPEPAYEFDRRNVW